MTPNLAKYGLEWRGDPHATAVGVMEDFAREGRLIFGRTVLDENDELNFERLQHLQRMIDRLAAAAEVHGEIEANDEWRGEE